MFKQSFKEFFQSKSNWMGMSGIAVGAWMIFNGVVREGIEAVFAGAAMIAIKDAVAKVK